MNFMKIFNFLIWWHKYYVEVKQKRYIIHPDEKSLLREWKEPKYLRNQYQVIIETQTRQNQKVIKFQNDELEVKPYPKKKVKQEFEKPKFDVECPRYEEWSCIEFAKGFIVKILIYY